MMAWIQQRSIAAAAAALVQLEVHFERGREDDEEEAFFLILFLKRGKEIYQSHFVLVFLRLEILVVDQPRQSEQGQCTVSHRPQVQQL